MIQDVSNEEDRVQGLDGGRSGQMRRINLQAFVQMIVSIVDKLQRQENVFKTLPFLVRGGRG